MKPSIKFPLPVLLTGLGLILAGRVTAQTFTTLHSFTAASTYYTNSEGNMYPINSDGANPAGEVILSGNTIYGTALYGGSSANGTVYKINTDGTGFTNLHSFTATPPYFTNSNGTVVYTNNDGAIPLAGLILSGNTLYGTAYGGGSSGYGTVFAVNTDGTGFTTLHSFTAGDPITGINSDGAYPYAGLILSGNTLYGTAELGGSSGWGTLFKVNTDGTDFTTLYSFTLGSDGGRPYGVLILSGNTLYGTAKCGGAFPGNGTVFAVNTDGTAFTTLYTFTAIINSFPGTPYTNSDGANPYAGLILSGNTLYGTAFGGGGLRRGTVFAVNTDGTGFTTLHAFTGGSDGAYPYAGLILSSNTLYGTALGGGNSGAGTVFSLSFSPQLTIVRSGPNVILTWPTNVAGFDYTGFTLQSTTNLTSPFWTTNSPTPVVVNAQNTVTNPISGTQQFFRLSQ